jgi:hypothetical protein
VLKTLATLFYQAWHRGRSTVFVIRKLTFADLASLMFGMERVDVSNGRFS